jgi:ornithine cyclodeaminase/alanine dehydrogenase-like protein (mu-crystallin family)
VEADTPHKQELNEDIFKIADVVADSIKQCIEWCIFFANCDLISCDINLTAFDTVLNQIDFLVM